MRVTLRLLPVAVLCAGCVESPTKVLDFKDEYGETFASASVFSGLKSDQSDRLTRALDSAMGAKSQVLSIEAPAEIITPDGQVFFVCGKLLVGGVEGSFFYTEGAPTGQAMASTALIVDDLKISCEALIDLSKDDSSVIGRYNL
jgi:hypothetical protein